MLLDIIGLLLLVAAVVKGMRQGLIGALFSLAAWMIGLVAALKLSAVVASRLSEYSSSTRWLPLISFLLVFILVAFLVNMAGRLISNTLDTVMLGWANKMAGAILFACIYLAFYSVLLFYAVQMKLLSPASIQASQLYPYLSPLAPSITEGIGSVIPFCKNIFHELEAFFSGVSNKMQH